ncbi:hypothetical protein NDU88_004278 [Pleurodeles waltl]|uniref:Uncharacterized protein n=1 Tax=Pleurodeles waltl TaxID=8319 RepID=A0AAV7V481_PLEWA|nr:hypothetical protein NDU88_004278 [Pleurodeles waltl]
MASYCPLRLTEDAGRHRGSCRHRLAYRCGARQKHPRHDSSSTTNFTFALLTCSGATVIKGTIVDGGAFDAAPFDVEKISFQDVDVKIAVETLNIGKIDVEPIRYVYFIIF